MHKSRLILLDNKQFWVLNRYYEVLCPPKLTNNMLEARLASEHGDHFFDFPKTMVQMAKNSLKEVRESLLMSKSELAREANVSPITITRIEEGKPCRLETKRKILLALGYSLSDSKKIFGE